LRDQIIEGLQDADTVEDLLKEKDLTLATTIMRCRSHEAAKKHCSDITQAEPSTIAVARAPYQVKAKTCSGCGGPWHKAGRQQCPAYNQLCAHCHKVGHFAKVCRTKPQPPPSLGKPGANAIHTDNQKAVQLFPLTQQLTEPAPKIRIQVTTIMGTRELTVLPDLGADILAAGTDILTSLGGHPNNLRPSVVVPKSVDGHNMVPLGCIPVTFSLQKREYHDNLYFLPGVTGAIISWKAARGLGILPSHYPSPEKPPALQMTTTWSDKAKLAAVEDIMKEYPTVFDGQIRVMEGEQFLIKIQDNAVPFCVKSPRVVPFAYRDKLKEELDLLQNQGIITPVTEATRWCAPIVVIPKKGTERVRMCVDLSKLNKFVVRERYVSPTPAEAVADIAAQEAKYFTVIDAAKGYHQCPLAPESQELTTFITPYGRFKYLQAPYGLSSIAEHYNRRMAEALEGLTGYRRIVDDIVIFDKDPQQHVVQFLERCKERQISINKEKWKFCCTEVTFAGFRLSPEGYQLDTSITEAISKFPTPTTRTELRAFIGLVNQLASGTNAIAGLMAPFCSLLSTKNEFVWTVEHDQAVLQAKNCLTAAPVLAFFDITKPTRLCTDASRQGLGFVLQQQSSDSTWHLVQAGSRCLTDTELRYAVIELELLAVTWAIWKCTMFLTGLPQFEVWTDHNPLVPILNSHRLDEIENPRLQRMRMKIMAFNFKAIWRKGATNQAPDALSRNPVSIPTPAELLAEGSDQDLSAAEVRGVHQSDMESIRLQDLRQQANEDHSYQQLKQCIMDGFPGHRHMLPEEIKPYWQVRHHLSVDRGGPDSIWVQTSYTTSNA